jgi:hypothetical protein
MFNQQVRIGDLIRPGVAIVSVFSDHPIFGPADECCLLDAKARCRLSCRQHSAIAKSIIRMANVVFVGNVGDTDGSKASLATP